MLKLFKIPMAILCLSSVLTTQFSFAQVKQPYPGPQRAADIINERQANQDKRIAAGKAAGQISPQEEAQLRQMAEFINNAERQANKGNQAPRQMGAVKAPGSGNIDPAEFDRIMGLLDQLSNKIQISREAEAVAVRMPNAPIQPVAGPTGSNVAQPPAATPALTMVSGDMQTAARNQMSNGIPTAMYAPLVVVAKDGTGKPLPGVAVTWSVGAKPGAMACQIEPSGASQGSVTTDAAGQAVLAKMGGRSTSIYYADGECQIVATYGGSSVSFRLNAAP